MSGAGARNRRKIKRAQEKESAYRSVAYGGLPVNAKKFYVWGRTYTKNSLRQSPCMGPYAHIRFCSETVWVSDQPGGAHEGTIAFYDDYIGQWIINHRDADQAGYFEVLVSLEKPQFHEVSDHGDEATEA